MPHTIGDAAEAMHVSPTTSRQSVEGPNSLEVAAKRLSSVDSPTVIPRVTWARLVRTVASPTTSFYLGPNAQCIIATAI